MDKLIEKNIRFIATAKKYKDKKENYFSVQIKDISDNSIIYIPYTKTWNTHTYIYFGEMIKHEVTEVLRGKYPSRDIDYVRIPKYGRSYSVIKCVIVKKECTKKEVKDWGKK
tara:strand:- start:1796 stop:2131 length:336 start_codon:yes stop_codon:yes gene_type:complete